VLIHVLSFLEPTQLLLVAQVCRRMNEAASSDRLWSPVADRLSEWFVGSGRLDAGQNEEECTCQECPSEGLVSRAGASTSRGARSKRPGSCSAEDCDVGRPRRGDDKAADSLCSQDIPRGGARLIVVFFVLSLCFKFVPDVVAYHSADVAFRGATLSLSLWDSPSAPEFDGLRPLGYSNADVFLFCFSVVSPASLASIATKWKPEVVHHKARRACPNAQFVLIGTKVDLRNDAASSLAVAIPCSREMGARFSRAIDSIVLGMVAYGEASAMSGEGVQALFTACSIIVLKAGGFLLDPKDKAKCVLQ
jgi:Ras-related C3 botulinum toxin substrate 1